MATSDFVSFCVFLTDSLKKRVSKESYYIGCTTCFWYTKKNCFIRVTGLWIISWHFKNQSSNYMNYIWELWQWERFSVFYPDPYTQLLFSFKRLKIQHTSCMNYFYDTFDTFLEFDSLWSPFTCILWKTAVPTFYQTSLVIYRRNSVIWVRNDMRVSLFHTFTKNYLKF